eukprot:TRINITY_DN2901_c0_g1_i2.p1 TRINITY_DN2901_c0_g1~~TRINITY_DN2901_c0_g1_i2.p1  ORF type:complete len:618 (-),score=140.71 TRINITY_DN2901_c0_g1_i2:87-1940(-)
MECLKIENHFQDNELQQFCDSLAGNLKAKYEFTMDYFDGSNDVVNDRDNPSLNFCVALLREILCNLKPSHELWDKIKYATFLLHLMATRPNIEFSVLYGIFYEVEENVRYNQWSWRETKVKTFVTEKIAEKFFVKDDVCSLPDVDDIKRDIEDDYEDSHDPFAVTNYDNDIDNDDNNEAGEKDNDAFSDDEQNDPDFVLNSKKERLAAKDEQNFNDEERGVIDKKVKVEEKPKRKRKRKIKDDELEERLTDGNVDPKKIKQEKPKRKRKPKQEIEDGLPKARGRAGRPRKNISYDENDEEGKAPPAKFFFCTVCNFKALNSVGLERHMFAEHEANRLCTQCGHLSDTYKDYLAHDKTHVYICEVCQKSVMGRKGLQNHMKSHEETKAQKDEKEMSKVPCDKCGKFVLQRSMYAHMSLVHATEDVKCDLCEFTTNAKAKLAKHRRLHFKRPETCPNCGKLVKDLKKHFFRKCGRSAMTDKFPCHLCNKVFSNKKEGLERHIKQVHEQIKNYHCEECEYRTYSGANLRLHVSKMHTKVDNERVCQFCNIKTRSLDYHLRIYHTDEKFKLKQQQQEEAKNKQESQDQQDQQISQTHQDDDSKSSQQQFESTLLSPPKKEI